MTVEEPRNPDLVGLFYTSLSISTSSTLLPAAGANRFRDIVDITLSNPSSASEALIVMYSTLTSGTVILKTMVAANTTIQLNFDPPLVQATANTILGVQSPIVGTTATVRFIERT